MNRSVAAVLSMTSSKISFVSNKSDVMYTLNGNISRVSLNGSEETGKPNFGCGESSVHDIKYNETIRMVTLYVTLITGIVGGMSVFIWMWRNRRLKARLNSMSRVNSFILNLTVADLSVMFFAVLPQLVWEYQSDREWYAGDVMCKTVKFMQSFTLMASTNMLVAIAIDRHIAIRSPLKSTHAVGNITCILFSLICNSAMPHRAIVQPNRTLYGTPIGIEGCATTREKRGG